MSKLEQVRVSLGKCDIQEDVVRLHLGGVVASNYEAICEENRESYGTKGAQKSGKLAAGLYDDRTHFIFELLQNAEDALGRRGEWHGSRKVAFTLSPARLTLSHFGKPFDEADVRSVCDIAESTKNESSIGRFGLGFKSVYTVTDLPEIHSGDEDFAIENYVFPKRLERSARATDETQIVLPLKPEDANAAQDITTGFRHLGPGALLFLRHIDEINWSVKGGASGFYLRNSPEALGPNVQRVTVIGQESGQPEVDQNWLVFHRDVFSPEGKKVGRVEIAFSLVAVKDAPGRWAVQPLAKSPLVVFFPTVVESYLGFLVQGPYRTTPSRDNIPEGDPWNQHLVRETSSLLVEAMRWMRDNAMLDVAVLRCLPLDREKFPKGSRFAPMFDAVRQAFQDEALLPTFDDGHVTAEQAKLARTQELRELFSPEQVAALFGSEVAAWLSGDITQDKAPEIRLYLMRELDIDEIRPENLVPRLTEEFLEAQSDEWVLRLYEFLSGQEKALRRHLDTVPLIRLDDGTHVVARENGKAKAFLPSAIATSFPTMRRAVCATPEVRQFLISLGITEPDPVDDVIWNLLPKYQQPEVDVDDDAYAVDIERIRAAFSTDSTAQREKLRSALRDTTFVMVVDTGDGKTYVAKPGEAYIATDRLQQLFAGVPDILIVDNEYDCLRGEEIRDLLVSCGASRYLIPEAAPSGLGHSEKAQIRREAGLERASWESPPEDFTLRGLTQLLEFLPTLKPAEAAARVKVLWEALADLEGRGTAAFYGSYKWGYSHEAKTARFDAAFVRTLNQMSWVPDADGELVPPGLVVFDTLGWKPNPFLLTKIAFKPPIIDQLAKEAGIDPAILDLLRRDPAIVAELASRLSASPTSEPGPSTVPEPEADEPSDGDVYDDASDLYGDDMPDIPPGTLDPDGGDGVGTGAGRGGHGRSGTGTSRIGGQGNGGAHGGSGGHGTSGGNGNGKSGAQGKRTPGHARGRPFISYVGTHPDDGGPDPDGLDQTERMQIEGNAIELIIGLEPVLRRTPEGNPGFDLFETSSSGEQIRWVEVKSMTGTLEDRPVGLSQTQFDFAREKGDAYWLYVVELASDPENARVIKIKNPVGHARTFTFDHGWRAIAQAE
ncbi:sacsin N-terminal ATP-binding-like domain-containing protein [Stenotrophomonas maltophilia]|uniref:sacsin N-terminal ATP-binding-like domain-containing protein n=1 Tax=Stenotrophomonas maltophilia TaxID=40324 RepID=UPI0034E1E293